MPEPQTSAPAHLTLEMLREAVVKLREEQPEHTVVASMEDYPMVEEAIGRLGLVHVHVYRHPSVATGTVLFFRDSPLKFTMEPTGWPWTVVEEAAVDDVGFRISDFTAN